VLVTVNHRQPTTVVYIILRKKYRMFNTYITNLMKHCENTGSQTMQNHLHNMQKHLRLIYRYSSYDPFTTLQMSRLH